MIPIVIGTFLALIGIGVATSHHEAEHREPQYIYVPQQQAPQAPQQPITIIFKDGKQVVEHEQERKMVLPTYRLVPEYPQEQQEHHEEVPCTTDTDCEQLNGAQ